MRAIVPSKSEIMRGLTCSVKLKKYSEILSKGILLPAYLTFEKYTNRKSMNWAPGKFRNSLSKNFSETTLIMPYVSFTLESQIFISFQVDLMGMRHS